MRFVDDHVAGIEVPPEDRCGAASGAPTPSDECFDIAYELADHARWLSPAWRACTSSRFRKDAGIANGSAAASAIPTTR